MSLIDDVALPSTLGNVNTFEKYWPFSALKDKENYNDRTPSGTLSAI
jgi:hypothetical protein